MINILNKKEMLKIIFYTCTIFFCACSEKIPPIHKLVRNNNDKALEKYVKQIENIDIRYKNNETALFTASFNGNLNAVKILIKHGADINAKNINNSTPLIYATINSHHDVIKFLLENGADVNAKDKLFGGVLTHSSMRAAAGPKDHMTGQLKIMQLLINYGADINQKSPEGETELFFASVVAPIEYLDFLINNGININTKNIYGETALFEPTRLGKNEVVLFLLRKGANPQITNIYDESLIEIAILNNHSEILNNLQRFSNNRH